MKLQTELWAIAKEYARQTGAVLGQGPEFWVGTDGDGRGAVGVCCFDDTLFLSLEEMQVIIDNLDEWVKAYGSKEAVGRQVMAWTEWWIEDGSVAEEVAKARTIHCLRPRISLRAWLSGLREADAFRDCDEDKLLKLERQEQVLGELIGVFGVNRSLGNVLDNVKARRKPLEEKVHMKRQEEWKRIMESVSGKEFMKAMEEAAL